MSLLRLRADDLAWNDLDGDIVALEPRASLYMTTNDAGALLWRLLARGAAREELVAALAAEYALDRAQAERDVDGFLRELSAHDLLQSA